MAYLIAASVAPIAGPLLYWALHERPEAVRVVDGFVYVAVPLLVGWQVLPYAWEERSVLVIFALGLGFLVPTGMERLSHALERHTDHVALVVGMSGVLVHALLEGAGFAPRSGTVPVPFALAVVVHRIPVGLVVWWLIRPRYGWLAASAGVALLILSTLAGYVIGMEVLADMHGPGVELYQAFVSGSLVHVVFHQGRHDHQHQEHG